MQLSLTKLVDAEEEEQRARLSKLDQTVLHCTGRFVKAGQNLVYLLLEDRVEDRYV